MILVKRADSQGNPLNLYFVPELCNLAGLDDEFEDDDEFEKVVVPLIPLGELIQPEDIAETVLFLASEQARMLTGQVIKVSGGHAL